MKKLEQFTEQQRKEAYALMQRLYMEFEQKPEMTPGEVAKLLQGAIEEIQGIVA